MFWTVSTSFHAMPAEYLAFRKTDKTPSPGCIGSWSRDSWSFTTASIIPIHRITSPSRITRRLNASSIHQRLKFHWPSMKLQEWWRHVKGAKLSGDLGRKKLPALGFNFGFKDATIPQVAAKKKGLRKFLQHVFLRLWPLHQHSAPVAWEWVRDLAWGQPLWRSVWNVLKCCEWKCCEWNHQPSHVSKFFSPRSFRSQTCNAIASFPKPLHVAALLQNFESLRELQTEEFITWSVNFPTSSQVASSR